MTAEIPELLKLGPRITVVPVIHGSGDCALEVRRIFLEHHFDCVAVPLPPSFQADVENALGQLPVPGVVVQRRWWPDEEDFSPDWEGATWDPAADEDHDSDIEDLDGDHDEDEDDDEDIDEDIDDELSYVPIDPCQPVIAALRLAIGEHIERAFIDLETDQFKPYGVVLPDPYALKRVSLAKFCATLLPSLGPLPPGQPEQRVAWMAEQLHQLAERHQSILAVISVVDWPELHEAFRYRAPVEFAPDEVSETEIYQAHPRSLMFMLGELPFITGLYERARSDLRDDTNLTIDGVKELLLTARDAYRREFRNRARKISPQRLATCVKYIRNLTLIHRRLSPSLYHIVIAAKQVLGDSFALHVAETAAEYPYIRQTGWPVASMGIERLRLPDGTIYRAVSRLPGIPLEWRSLELNRRPSKEQISRWTMQWNPYEQCSWPPEDKLIEDFRTHVAERARQIMGADLIQTEKFTTSVKDGIDIRDTLRNWHTGEIFVKVLPPTRGDLNAVVMLFDSPADPRSYPWRTTWFAEHQNESTLAFFATDFRREIVGPGICCGSYGGALFLFPPRPIPDIWTDPRLDFTETLEERLLGAACLHAQSTHIALMAPGVPGAGWRRLARRFRKKWIHVPLSQFSEETLQKLRIVHVLNGKQVRSYAAHFIRRP